MLARLRPFAPTTILGLLIFYFGFHALTGDQGLLGVERRGLALATKEAELERVRSQRMDLEARAKLLRDGNVSADLIEERARSMLGFSDPKDYVIRLKP